MTSPKRKLIFHEFKADVSEKEPYDKRQKTDGEKKETKKQECMCKTLLNFTCESMNPQFKTPIVTNIDGKQWPEFLWCPHCKIASRRLWWCHYYGMNKPPQDWHGMACAEFCPQGIQDCKPTCSFLPCQEETDDNDDDDENEVSE